MVTEEAKTFLKSGSSFQQTLAQTLLRDVTSVDRDPIVTEKMFAKCLAAATDVESLFENLKVSREQIQEIEKLTRGQKSSKWWSEFRAGRLTASNFSVFISCHKGSSVVLSKTASVILNGGVDLSGISAARWGIEHEGVALSAYSAATGREVFQRGLQLHPSGFLGASVDGITSDGIVIEVKCPFNDDVKTKGPLDTIGSPKSYFQYTASVDKENLCERVVLLENVGHSVCFLSPSFVSLKATGQGKKFMAQIQGQLSICDAVQCDFVVWTPKESVVLPISRDASWGAKNIPLLTSVFQAHAESLFSNN